MTRVPSGVLAPPDERAANDELSAYTLTHGAPAFIHQHVVDAFAAQYAGAETKPVNVAFALVGLYLHLERGFTGREVQLAHMKLAAQNRHWPTFDLPDERGSMHPSDVLRAAPGEARDAAIDEWCADVWRSYHTQRDAVIALLTQYHVIPTE